MNWKHEKLIENPKLKGDIIESIHRFNRMKDIKNSLNDQGYDFKSTSQLIGVMELLEIRYLVVLEYLRLKRINH